MAGAPTILAQAVPCLLNAFPGWKQPTHCRVRATIGGGSGAATVVAAKTTPGCSVARLATAQYRVTFPNCRDLADVNVQIYQVAPETDANSSSAHVDADTTETNAATGRFKFHTFHRDDGLDDAELADGDIIEATFWLDLG